MNKQIALLFKVIILAFVFTILASQSIAQTTNGIFFQAVARDNFSNPAKDRQIYVESSIIQTTSTGTKVLIELHKTTTDAMGVFNISLGNGTRTGGSASSLGNVDWSKGPFFLNLKIAITPFSASDSWNYTKELVDMGTTSFGTVPFALYSASSAKVDNKLDASDTTVMLKAYAKAVKVQSLETAVASKLTAADTLTMLAPYAKAAYTIDSSFFKAQLATKLNLADSIFYTKQKYTDSAFSKKLNIADSALYVTKSQLASYNFSSGGGGVTVDTSSLSNRINLKANATELTNMTNTLTKKLNIADSTKYITPTQLASYNFPGGGGTTVDTTSLSNRINLKANVLDMTSALAAEATTARAAELTLTNNIAANTASITANATAIVSQATTARAAELVLTNNITANTASITANTVSIGNLNSSLTSNITITASNTTAIGNLNTSMAANTTNIATNTSAIASEATTARAAELTLTNNVAANISSITSNTTSINNLNTNVVSNISSITSLNTIITAATNSNTVNTIVKRDASGNFSAGTINATSINTPIYASAPQSLIDESTISWNPTLGLNASVTLGGNRTLSFFSTPTAGSYGTLVVTQDATGGRTLTLPSTANKVLGSSSTTTIALSTSANAKDILNFYYDGTNCYWNIGQGYGSAATAPLTLTTTGTGAATLSGTTLNIPVASATVNAGSISGTIALANGGTGASSQQASINALTGTQSSGKYLRSDGTNATLTTIQAADVPTLNQSTTGNAATATTAGNITATSNSSLTSLSNLNTVGTITSGTISVTTNIKTSSTLTTGTVTYPNTHGTTGQVLSTTGSGTLTWTTPSSGGAGSGGHYVGEVYGGGIVFYITTGGYHGLIASSTDIVSNPMVIFDRATSPSYKFATNSENLYTDWVTPTFSQLNILYSARATTGLNLSSQFYISSTFTDNDAFGFRGLNFSNNSAGYANGNWSSGSSGGEIRGRAIRSF